MAHVVQHQGSEWAASAASQHAGDQFLTTDDLAELARTTAATCRYWRHVGYGPTGFKVGRRVLYERSEVFAWLDRLRSAQGSVA